MFDFIVMFEFAFGFACLLVSLLLCLIALVGCCGVLLCFQFVLKLSDFACFSLRCGCCLVLCFGLFCLVGFL